MNDRRAMVSRSTTETVETKHIHPVRETGIVVTKVVVRVLVNRDRLVLTQDLSVYLSTDEQKSTLDKFVLT